MTKISSSIDPVTKKPDSNFLSQSISFIRSFIHDNEIKQIPSCAEYIKFPHYFDQEFKFGAQKHLKFIDFSDCDFNESFPNKLPSSLEYVIFGSEYKKPFPNHFENNIKYASFHSKFKHSLKPLNNLKELSWNTKTKLPSLPMSLKSIHFVYSYNKKVNWNDLPKNLKCIEFGRFYNSGFSGSFSCAKLKYLIFDDDFNQILPENLPDSIKLIQFERSYNQELPSKLPNSLVRIKFGTNYNQELPETLPDSVQSIYFGEHYTKLLPMNLPKQLKIISMNTSIYQIKSHKIKGEKYCIVGDQTSHKLIMKRKNKNDEMMYGKVNVEINLCLDDNFESIEKNKYFNLKKYFKMNSMMSNYDKKFE